MSQNQIKCNDWEEICLGGLGAMCACVFTNPLEMIKSRIQLQGELRSRGHYTVYYKNVFQAFYAVVKLESLRSLQNGLMPALCYQFIMNGCRFGAYQVLDNKGFTRNTDGANVLYKTIFCSMLSGGLGTFLGNPFYLMKVHLQSKSDSTIAVGNQHRYSRMGMGFRTILTEQGLQGLWLGGSAAILRGAVCGSTQMTAFTYIHNYIDKKGVSRRKRKGEGEWE